MKNIYIIGAQCTGKTTLVNALEQSLADSTTNGSWGGSAKHQPTLIREVARTVLKEKSFTRDDLSTSPSRALQLQKHILEGQFHAETAASANPKHRWYICDRSGLDPIVYAKLFSGKDAAEKMLRKRCCGKDAAEKMLESTTWGELETRMKAGIVIMREAGCEWLMDDGTRLMPTGMEDWMKVDSGFRELLKARGISFTTISSKMVELSERVEFVKRAMKSAGCGVDMESVPAPN